MELNEIKKKLYKESSSAILQNVSVDGILYTTSFGEDTITFLVPLNELGTVKWGHIMPAQLLIRYII